MQNPSPSSNSTILTSANGPRIVEGGVRFSEAEEKAINLILRRDLGEFQGMPNYKIGWAVEDNHATWDATSGSYKYDPDKRTPICFHPNQASYHLLTWEPPVNPAALAQIKGEDTSKGSYNCVFHFVDQKTDEPYHPNQIRVQLIEIVIPTMKQINEIALASRHGYEATQNRLRKQFVERVAKQETKKAKDYESYATALLENDAPAFEGQPFSPISGTKGRQFSDLKPGEFIKPAKMSDIPSAIEASQPEPQPTEFSFSVKSRRPKE